jgi:RND family efflux transporter MFP subunit
VPESDITTVTLTEQAETRLGIKVAPLEKRTLDAVRTIGGEVVIPPGRSLVVTAPVAGLVLTPAQASMVLAGASVEQNQPLLELVPLPPDRDIARAREDLSVAEARHAEARLEAERVQKLFADRLVSTREYERVQANFRAAEATLQNARAQFEALTQGTVTSSNTVATLTIRSPVSGVVRAMQVAPRQTVAAGAPLFELDQLDRLWVRVPVYVGDVNQLATGRAVTVATLGGQGVTRRAQPVRAPPSANPSAASADIFYQLIGTANLRPGERVNVMIPLRSGASEQLVVPWSAILHDAQGGAWVYEQIRPQVYARRRVDLSHVQGDLAVLARGPVPGTVVVIEGAAELFGTEFGAGH